MVHRTFSAAYFAVVASAGALNGDPLRKIIENRLEIH